MSTDTIEHGNYGQPVPEFPPELSGRTVIDHQRIASREGEIPLAIVLLRNPNRPEGVAYEVCTAGLRYGAWQGSSTSHSLTHRDAMVEYDQRIIQRGAI